MVSEPEDPTGVHFRLRKVRAGVALSVFCCVYLATRHAHSPRSPAMRP